MAANSLLFLLLTTGLTTPPDQSVTTESYYGINTEYTREPSNGPTEDTVQWHDQTQWPGYGGPRDTSIRWGQEPEYSTENPSHQETAPTVTENENAEWISLAPTERPFDQSAVRTYPPYDWPLASEEPEDKTQRPETRRKKKDEYSTENPSHQDTAPTVTENENADWISLSTTERPSDQSAVRTYPPYDLPSATEEPEDRTKRPEIRHKKKGKRKCPKREHFTKCHKNCEKTCSDYMKPRPCPKSCKSGCVCDGGLVRNKEGKCVPRDQCQKKVMAEDDDSHGCPYEYACDVYCIRNGLRTGGCEGSICKCRKI